MGLVKGLTNAYTEKETFNWREKKRSHQNSYLQNATNYISRSHRLDFGSNFEPCLFT